MLIHKINKYPTKLCILLNVEYRSYNYFVKNGFKLWNSYDKNIDDEIKKVFNVKLEIVEAAQISRQLKTKGINLGPIGVKRYLNLNNLIPQVKKYKNKTNKPVDTGASPRLTTDFNIKDVDTLWAHDNAEFPYNGGKLHVLLFQDIASRYNVGISIKDTSFTGDDVIKTLERSLKNHGVNTNIVLLADNGTEGKNKDITSYAEKNNIKLVYSEPRKPWQNGVPEALIKTAKKELFYKLKTSNREQAITYITWWFQVWYNKERIHSYGELTPLQLRNKLRATT